MREPPIKPRNKAVATLRPDRDSSKGAVTGAVIDTAQPHWFAPE